MYEIASGARYAKIAISGSETVKFPCTYGVFGVKGDNITVKLSETASGDGVYNTADGGGYILIAHYAHLDTVYLSGSGEVIVWAGNSPLDNPLKKAMSGYTPVTVESLSVNTNGTYTAPSGKAYSPVVVDVQEEPWTPLQDGYSNFWVNIPTDRKTLALNLYSKNNNAVIDWGDGTGETALDTLTPSHTYSDSGKYIIKLKGVTGIGQLSSVSGIGVFTDAFDYIELNNEVVTATSYICRYVASLRNIKFNALSGITWGTGAFMYCGVLTEFNNNTTVIASSQFQQCFSLRNVDLGEVVSIGSSAFNLCTSLSSISIPSTITSIDNYAFRYCTSLSEVHIAATSPPTLGASVFDGLPASWLCYVPVGYGDTYKSAAGWSVYEDHILEEGQQPTRAMLSKFENTKKSDDIEIEDKR